MTFTKVDDYHGISDCRRYAINAAGTRPRVYMAVRLLGKRSRIVGVFRARTDDERAEAYLSAVAACQTDAHANQ